MRALEMGAIDFRGQTAHRRDQRPARAGRRHRRKDPHRQRGARVSRRLAAPGPQRCRPVRPRAPPPRPHARLLPRLSTEKVICIGASTGGTEAIKDVLVELPADSPAIVITQHMPPASPPVLRRAWTRCARSGCRRHKTASASCPVTPTSPRRHPVPHRTQRRQLRGRGGRLAAGEPAQAFGGGAVQVLCPGAGAECHWRHADRHGRRWRRGHERNARCGQPTTLCRTRPVAWCSACRKWPSSTGPRTKSCR
jgi:hypothetical protein